MKSYYNEKKYNIRKAMRVAKKVNNQEALIYLKTLYQISRNIVSVDFIRRVNSLHFRNADLFNVEKILEEKPNE